MEFCWKEDRGTLSRAEGSGCGVQEAGDLFSERVRSALAMKHLWDEREPSLKFKEDGMLTGDCGGEERGKIKEPGVERAAAGFSRRVLFFPNL